jgi:ribosomal protein S18 acetylase RimI-like enzyme
MAGFVIRRATEQDAPVLGRLGALLMRVHFGLDRTRFMDPGDDPEAGYAWFLRTQLRQDAVAVFVAEQEGSVVGYVYAGIEPQSWKELRERAGFIHDIVVTSESRRGGVARELMTVAMDWLAASGAPRVLLWTATGNTGAQALFESLGFRKTMIEMTRELNAPAAAE